jgi:hypothetical protein
MICSLKTQAETRLYGGWVAANPQKRRDFQGFLRVAKKGGYIPPSKRRNPREKGTSLWFLTPEMTRIFAEII